MNKALIADKLHDKIISADHAEIREHISKALDEYAWVVRNDLQEWLISGLRNDQSPWADRNTREIAHVFEGYIRNRIDEFERGVEPKEE